MENPAEKLATLLAQKNQIDAIIATDPTNAQYRKIQDDLQQLITLTHNLVALQQQSTSTNDGAADTNDGARDDSDSDLSDEDDNEHNGRSHDEILQNSDGSFPVDSLIEVVGGDRPYAAIVVGGLENGTYRIKYFEFEAEVFLPAANLRRLPRGQLEKDEVTVGLRGQCKYSQDQLYYDAVVTALTKYGAMVTYTQYGNSEEVPIAYLRPLIQKQKKEADPHALIKIPDNLKILPTDTEEEKMRKKKKIKAIKSKNRLVTKEAEVSAVQNTWKKFVTKASKKIVGGVTKTSMFASPDAVEGRVGVTNSGKGLTDFAGRTKHKF